MSFMAGTDTGEDNAAARLVRAVDAVARVRLIKMRRKITSMAKFGLRARRFEARQKRAFRRPDAD